MSRRHGRVSGPDAIIALSQSISKLSDTLSDMAGSLIPSTPEVPGAAGLSASIQSHRSKRRAEAIDLVMDTSLNRDRQKRLIRRFKDESDLVETLLSVHQVDLREDLMRDFADETLTP